MAARPATRSSTATNTQREPGATRPTVRDFAGGSVFAVEWDVRPVFDFMFSLSSDAGHARTTCRPTIGVGSTDDQGRLAAGHPGRPQDPQRDRDGDPRRVLCGRASGTPDRRGPRDRPGGSDRGGPRRRDARRLRHRTGHRGRWPEPRPSGDQTALDTMRRGRRRPRTRGQARPRRPRCRPTTGSCASSRRGPSRSRPSRHGSHPSASATSSHAWPTARRWTASTSSSGPPAASAGCRPPGSAGSSSPRRTSAGPYNFLLGGEGWRFFGYPVADEAARGRRSAGAAARRSSASIGRSATRPGCGSSSCCAGRDLYAHRDRPTARAIEADHQAPPRAPARGGRRDDHRVGRRHLLQPPAQPA